jgi:cysteinyl-tRNA synthetase
MSMKLLGPTFDIHGGGQDLIFPHHENERAQSEGYTGKPFARYWLHNGFVTINQEKMSKSLGNVFNLRDIYKVFSPRVVRFFLLSQHYRSPVDYSEEALKEAKRALFRLDNCYGMMMDVAVDFSSVLPEEEAMGEFKQAMNDDFNTAAALAIVYKIAEEFFKNYRQSKALEDLKPKLSALKEICSILGVELINPIHELSDPDQSVDLSGYLGVSDRIIQEGKLTEGILQTLGHCREMARKNKDWDLADRIRDYLKDKDITIMDRPGRSSALVYYREWGPAK